MTTTSIFVSPVKPFPSLCSMHLNSIINDNRFLRDSRAKLSFQSVKNGVFASQSSSMVGKTEGCVCNETPFVPNGFCVVSSQPLSEKKIIYIPSYLKIWNACVTLGHYWTIFFGLLPNQAFWYLLPCNVCSATRTIQVMTLLMAFCDVSLQVAWSVGLLKNWIH